MRLQIPILAGLAAAVLVSAADRATFGRVPLDPEDGVVIPATDAHLLLEQCTRDVPDGADGYWTPSAADVRALERRLPRVVERSLRLHFVTRYMEPFPAEPLPDAADYHRAYAGVVIGGRRLIYVDASPDDDPRYTVSGAPDAPGAEPRVTGYSMICDGGFLFFGALYDPARDRVLRVDFNYG